MRKKEALKTNKPPEKLSELIEMMNYVPADFSLPAADKVLENVFYEISGTAAPADWILQNAFYEKEQTYFESIPGDELSGSFQALCAALETIKRQLTAYPTLIENILPANESYEEFFFTWKRFQDYTRLRQDFLSVLSRIEEFRAYDFDKEKIPYYTSLHLPAMTTFDFDENNRITFQNNFLIKALEGADPERLRRCEVCKSVFWAYRLNTKFCSKKCADVYFQRQRRFNKSKNDAINDRRRKNYERTKKLEKLRKENNSRQE